MPRQQPNVVEESTSVLHVEEVNTKEGVPYYAGKRIYKAKTKRNGTTVRCIWAKVTCPHDNSDIVGAKQGRIHGSSVGTMVPPPNMQKSLYIVYSIVTQLNAIW